MAVVVLEEVVELGGDPAVAAPDKETAGVGGGDSDHFLRGMVNMRVVLELERFRGGREIQDLWICRGEI